MFYIYKCLSYFPEFGLVLFKAIMTAATTEDLIEELGGCGKYQWLTSFFLQSSKTIIAFSMLAMTFNGQQPDFSCISQNNTRASNETGAVTIPLSACEPDGKVCDEYVFHIDDMNTIVNEVMHLCQFST